MFNTEPCGMNNVVNYAVVADYNPETDTGIIVKNDMTMEEANAYVDLVSMASPMSEFVIKYNPQVPTEPEKMRKRYCTICGGSGVDWNGETCQCQFNPDSFFDDVSCMEIPEQYRGIKFNSAMVPRDVDESYGKRIMDLCVQIPSMRISNHNYLICSPSKHGKTIFAYTCLNRLFQNGSEVFPVCDIMELRKIMHDVDTGQYKSIHVSNPESVWTSPYLFAKIPLYPTWEVYDSINTLLNRRTRHNGVTILLYSGTLAGLIKNDKLEIITSLRGDGSYGTVEVLEWRKKVNDTEDD